MYLTWLGALAVYLLHICTDIEGSCEDQVEQAQFDGKVVGKYEDKCYAFSRLARPFFRARDFCKTLNGDLATIPSQQMSTVLSEILPPGRTTYVGAIDRHQRNEWEWLNGDPVTWTNWYDEKAMSAVSESPDGMRCLIVVNSEASVIKWDVVPSCSSMSNQYLCEYDHVKPTPSMSMSSTAAPQRTGTYRSPREKEKIQRSDHVKPTPSMSMSSTAAPQRTGTYRSPREKEKIQRSVILTRVGSSSFGEMPVPGVNEKTQSMLECSGLCVRMDLSYDTMAYNTRTKECMCYVMGAIKVRLDKHDPDGPLYFRIRSHS